MSVDTDCLPDRLPAGIRRETEYREGFGGRKDGKPSDGWYVEDRFNVSPASYPALETRCPRGLYMGNLYPGSPHGMAVMGDRIFFVRGTVLYRCESPRSVEAVGEVSDTDKQFSVFGDRLIIMPDKLIYTEASGQCLPMELDSGKIEKIDFLGECVTLPRPYGWQSLGFRAGNSLRVINADDVTPAPEGIYRIRRVVGQSAYIEGGNFSHYVSTAILKREVPLLDGSCVIGNRLLGFHGNRIYLSEVGNPFNWYAGQGVDGDIRPFSLTSETEGDFTACAVWRGYAVFFKENAVGRILGRRFDTFTLSETPCQGIPKACGRTLCAVGGELYYHGISGVYRYDGQEPELVKLAKGPGGADGCSGTDGWGYYLFQKGADGEREQVVYIPETGQWHRETPLDGVSAVTKNGYLYVQDADGCIWQTSSDGRATDLPFPETAISGPVQAVAECGIEFVKPPTGGRLSCLYLRVSLDEGTVLTVSIRYDEETGTKETGQEEDGASRGFRVIGTYTGACEDRILTIPVYPRRCQSYRLLLHLNGHGCIRAMGRCIESGGRMGGHV